MADKIRNKLFPDKQWLPVVLLAVTIIVLSAYMVYRGTEKEGFYIDEMFSVMNIRGGGLDRPYYYKELFNIWYTGQELESTVGVTAKNAFTGIFNADNLYWSLLHIAYSFSPDNFSAWPGVILNIIFFAGCLAVIYLLSQLFIDDKYLAMLPGLLWGVSSAAVNLVMYIRFYCLKTLICLLLTYVVFCAVKNKFNKWIYPAAIALLMCTGAFIHQYFFVFAFFLTAVVCFYLLITKNFKSLFIFAGLMAAGALIYELVTGGGITGILTVNIDEITEYNRAEEAMGGLLGGVEGYADRIKAYYAIINRAVFAGINLYIILVLIVIFISVTYIAYTRKATICGEKNGIIQFIKETDVQLWLLLFGICLCYFLMISRISLHPDLRYMFCITPFIFILLISLMTNVPRMLGFNNSLIIFIILALPCSLFFINNIENIYIKRDPGAQEVLSEYYHLPVICMNGGGEQISRCYWLLFDFENQILLTDDKVDMDVAKEKTIEDGLIFMYPTHYGGDTVAAFMEDMGFEKSTHLLTLVRHSVFLLE